jgi:hypothetical protein
MILLTGFVTWLTFIGFPSNVRRFTYLKLLGKSETFPTVIMFIRSLYTFFRLTGSVSYVSSKRHTQGCWSMMKSLHTWPLHGVTPGGIFFFIRSSTVYCVLSIHCQLSFWSQNLPSSSIFIRSYKMVRYPNTHPFMVIRLLHSIHIHMLLHINSDSSLELTFLFRFWYFSSIFWSSWVLHFLNSWASLCCP